MTTFDPQNQTPDVETFQQRIDRERQQQTDAYDALIARAPAILAAVNAADKHQGSTEAGPVVLGDWTADVRPADPDSFRWHRSLQFVHPSGMAIDLQYGSGQGLYSVSSRQARQRARLSSLAPVLPRAL